MGNEAWGIANSWLRGCVCHPFPSTCKLPDTMSAHCPSIVAGLFVLIIPTLQLTGRTLRVRVPYSLSLLFLAVQSASPGTLLVLNRKTHDVCASLMSFLFLFLFLFRVTNTDTPFLVINLLFMLHPLVLIALILDLRCTYSLKVNIQEFVRSRDDTLSTEIIHILSMLSRDQRAWYDRLSNSATTVLY